MKKIIVLILAVVLIAGVIIVGPMLYNQDDSREEQQLIEQTYTISKRYIAVRYQTDHLLVEAEKYSYKDWNQAMNRLQEQWKTVLNNAETLDQLGMKFSTTSFGIQTAHAMNKSEVTAIFDAAPAGRKIVTLAKHLGVDAKRAMAILRQDQDQVTADAWNEAGDTFQKLETSATVIKDGCKVVGFVGGIVVTGGVSAIAAGSTLAKAAVVVGGADLILEVSDDAAKIAFGNHNKVSAVLGDVRKVTEPISTLLNINEIPNNLKDGVQKFSAVMVALEQFNSAAQEGKIVGVQLPAYKPTEKFTNIKKYKQPVYVSVMNTNEMEEWLKELEALEGEWSPEEIEKIYGEDIISEDKTVDENESIENDMTGEEGTGALELVMQPVPESNDWQAVIRIALFAGAPIKVVDGKIDVSFSKSFSVGKFEGTGRITIQGTYDAKTGVMSGTHFREYDGTYGGEPRTIVYRGNFNQVIPQKGEEVKINFDGQVSTTRLDGGGKSYITTDSAGTKVVYLVR